MVGLTRLQSEILRLFFAQRDEFFLTGGAALAGFHLGHRETHDLDLFTTRERLDEGERTLRAVAAELELEVESVRRETTFRRFLLGDRHHGEAVLVDLVRDLVPQLREKIVLEGVIVDPPEEILANKLCALLSRTEIRDLVDVMKLAERNFDPVATVSLAAKKDAGMSASQLAWALSSFPIPAESDLPGGVGAEELKRFRDDLVRKLLSASFPERAS